MYNKFKNGALLLLLLLLLQVVKLNGIIIGRDGDHIFGLTSNDVYSPLNLTGQYSYYSINDVCYQFKNDLDIKSVTRMLISRSLLSSTIIVSFKGTDNLNDVFTDIQCIKIDCPFSSFRVDCGEIHEGFATAYLSVRESLEFYFSKLEREYDVYLTGHSLGGSVALVALTDILSRENNFKMIKSLNVVTFGQPTIGDEQLNKFLKDNAQRYTYRRYVNTNGFNNQVDAAPDILPMSYHPNQPINLQCQKRSCPSLVFGLHSMSLYLEGVYNAKYSTCRTNCSFKETKSGIFRYKELRCTALKDSIIEIQTQGSDYFAVCLMSSDQFYDYDYKANQPCHINGDKNFTPLINKQNNPINQKFAIRESNDYVIILENHNRLFTTSFSYNITLRQVVEPPSPPRSLVVAKEFQYIKNGTSHYLWKVNWKNPEFIGLASNRSTIDYYLYLSPITDNWRNFKFTEPVTSLFINRTIKDIPNNNYTVVVVANNSQESHHSNIIYVTSEVK